MPSKTTIQIRKGASKSWESSNPVLQQGELVFVQDKNQIKIGDGVSNYNELPGIVFDGGDLDNPIATNTLYFTGSVDNNWSNAGNWFSDSAGTVAAGGIPTTTDNVVILSSVQNAGSNPTVANMIANGAITVDPIVTVNGIATFNDTVTNSGTVNGNAIFNDNSSNDGTVAGNATFNATSTNEGSVTGTATFNGSSVNTSTGTVGGNANFNDNSVNEGDVTGTATFTGNSYNDGGTAGTFVPNPPPSTPSTTPSAPTITGITSGNGQLTVAFTAPNSNGGSAITNYKYSTNGGSTFTAVSPAATTSPITITGLNNGTSYNVQIRAVNANGDGTATGSTSATPAAPTSSSSSSSSAVQALGALPVGQAGGAGDPFFTLARIAPCNAGQQPFFAQWEDNGTNCINRMLFVHLETLRYTLTIYHTNKILPGVEGSVIDSVEVVYNGQSTTYNSTSSFNNRINGEIALQLVSSSFQGSSSSSSVSFLQMNFGWVRQINDVVTLGGGVGVVLKKVIQEGGYWESPTGNDVNGFGLAGAFMNITRADLEAAASAGPNTLAWLKVMFSGADFNALMAIAGVCRPPRNRAWDPVVLEPVDEFKDCATDGNCWYCTDAGTATSCSDCPPGYECFGGSGFEGCQRSYWVSNGSESCSDQLGSPPYANWNGPLPGYCCGFMCYPHQVTCTIQSVKSATPDCINSGDSQTCCGDSAYTVINGPGPGQVTCSSPFPTCSSDNINPVLLNVPEGFSVINCS